MTQIGGSNVLVVGGAGFVGSNLVKLLLDASPAAVTIVDNFLSSEKSSVPEHKAVRLIEGSIADDRVLNELADDFDYIFHLATYHGNQSSIHDPLADHQNNTLTTLKLLNHIRDFKRLRKFVYSAAGCAAAEKTFDDAQATTEDASLSLIQDSPYSISKIVGEYYAVYFHKQHGVPTVRARFQNVYGPGEILGAGQWRGTPATVWRNVTPTFIYKALKGQVLPVQGDGVTTRDFIFVTDICRGLIACALNGRAGDVYNIASGSQQSILDLARFINELTKNKGGVQILPRRSWDNSGKRFGSTAKAEAELGFKASVPFEAGLRETVSWTHEHLGLIEACIAKHAARMKGSQVG